MGELEAIDPALLARGGEGEPRVGERVQLGPVQALAPGETASATVALLGIADDRGVTDGGGRAGASEGPRELRRWLYAMSCGGGGELAALRLFDLGDATPGPGNARSLEEVHALAEEAVRAALAAGARVVLLGGGHDGACASHAGLLRALAPHAKVAAINVDARCDVGPLRGGTRVTSDTTFRRLKERWRDRYALVEFGVQMQHNARAQVEWAHAQGWPVLELRRLREDGVERRFVRQLVRARGSSDALAVSVESGQRADGQRARRLGPLPDGFTAGELCAFARDAGRESAVRLLDVMECAPALDLHGATARLGAAAIWSFLAGACEST